MESSCECGNGPSGSIKCWETVECQHNWWPLVCSAQFHMVIQSVTHSSRSAHGCGTVCSAGRIDMTTSV
jgi:hypothetical protein